MLRGGKRGLNTRLAAWDRHRLLLLHIAQSGAQNHVDVTVRVDRDLLSAVEEAYPEVNDAAAIVDYTLRFGLQTQAGRKRDLVHNVRFSRRKGRKCLQMVVTGLLAGEF